MGERFLALVFSCALATAALAAEPPATPTGAAPAPPPPTAPERAAAFPDVSGHPHEHEDALTAAFTAERFEWQERDGDDAVHWDVSGWIGYDMNRLWLRDEGEHVSGETVENEVELLWGRPVAAFWDVVAGVRHDTGDGPSRTYAALGVQGLAPQWFHIEATAYLGERGQSGLELEAEYEWLLTNRLILAARAEGEAWGEDDEVNGIGSGFSSATVGARLRYEIRREFAPYVGVEWSGLYGDTEDLARESGEETRDTQLVAGLRFWF